MEGVLHHISALIWLGRGRNKRQAIQWGISQSGSPDVSSRIRKASHRTHHLLEEVKKTRAVGEHEGRGVEESVYQVGTLNALREKSSLKELFPR